VLGEDFGTASLICENYEIAPIILNDSDGSLISNEMTGVSLLFTRGKRLLPTRTCLVI
jgi:hypothetical protein